nr:glycine betaine ABC transporter substrate-binding protein [Maliibacterium massiliense]
MGFITEFFQYVAQSKDQILSLLLEHVQLTAISVGLALLIGVPLGVLVSYVKKLNKPVLGIANVIQAIPSMALLGFVVPFLGIGTVPAVTMVVLYSLLPIIKNTYTGIDNIAPETLEAAKGIGLTKPQILFKVQIPLALPVIMAGVRISAVTAVGLMTIAAFIGAGGLGFLVFSGIRTLNNYQILAGAIPACLLALFVDYLFGLIEKLVTPISLQRTNGASPEKLKKNRRHQKVILSATAIILAIAFVWTGVSAGVGKTDKSITISGVDYTEQEVLEHMFADIIEDRTDITVERKNLLSGTQVCFSALQQGEIDMYIEYTGTVYVDIMKNEPITDVDKVYEEAKAYLKDEHNIETLPPIGFNNTYVLAVTQQTAEKYNLKTVSDLAKVGSQLKAGTTLEFINRQDGLKGLTEKYGFQFQESVGLNGSLRYIALDNGEIDVTSAFSTDGLLKKYNLVSLEDDQHFFPPYYAMPIVRAETLEKYPELQEAIEVLCGVIDDDTMKELNYQVDELHREPRDVAHEFLQQKGLLLGE